MTATRRQYTREYKVEAVRLVQQGDKSLAQVARELGIRADLLRKWRQQLTQGTDRPASELFPGSGKQSPQEEELRRLRREVEVLRQERDFLKQAAAYFAKESK